MKAITTLLLFVCLGLYGQDKQQKCKENLSIYDGLVKTKQLDKAYPYWKMVNDSCPAIHRANFTYGKKILKHKIANASEEEKANFIRALLNLHISSLIHFPTYSDETKVTIDTLLIKHDHNMISIEDLHAALNKNFDADPANFKNPKALYLLFSTGLELQQSGTQNMEQVMAVYDKVTSRIDAESRELTKTMVVLQKKQKEDKITTRETNKLKSYTSYIENYKKVTGSINAMFKDASTCENLMPIYEKQFDSKKNDVDWVKNAVSMLFNKACIEEPIFDTLFQQQLLLDPSAEGYYYSGILKEKKGDVEGALADFKKAVTIESSNAQQCNIAFKLAMKFKDTNPVVSRSFAQKTIASCPGHGKAYLLIGQLYANSANSCGSNEFEKRAIYWKAAEMARKAGKLDSSISRQFVKETVANYMGKAPTREMIFNSDMAGKTIYFKCWVGGSVVVPKL